MTRTISPATFRMLALVAFGSVAGFGEPPDSAQTLRRYLNGQTSACRLDEQAMEIEIEASLPKLKKEGTMQGVKVISASGRVAYRFLRFTGDKLIKTDVIARFLTAEVHPPEHLGNIGTTQENYKFHFLRQANYQGHTAYVFQLRPRKKREGLFKGELWLSAESAAPLREVGELVKSPSIFVKQVTFVRDYSEQALCRPPQHTAITVQTRIMGDAEMVVWQNPVSDTWRPEVDSPADGIADSTGANGR